MGVADDLIYSPIDPGSSIIAGSKCWCGWRLTQRKPTREELDLAESIGLTVRECGMCSKWTFKMPEKT